MPGRRRFVLSFSLADGKYQDQIDTASVSCSDCPAGRYLTDIATAEGDHDAQTDCLFCAAGKEFMTAITLCTDCTPGAYQQENAAPSVQCTSCAPGQASVDSSTPCVDCVRGQFQELTAATSYGCKACAGGNSALDSKTACVLCAAGKIKTVQNVYTDTA